MDVHDGDVAAPPSSDISCSICLDLVSYTGDRSRAKLQCGPEFHLDCIGSAFNMKGAMQCPICQKVEEGQWLYANGSTRSLPVPNMENLDDGDDDDDYEPVYSEMIKLTFAELATSSSVAYSHFAYFEPPPPTTLRSNDSVYEPNCSLQWNILDGQNEIFAPLPTLVSNIIVGVGILQLLRIIYSYAHTSNTTDTTSIPAAAQGSSTGEPNASTRSRSFPHHSSFEHGSSSRAGSSFVSSGFPHHPGSDGHAHGLIQTSVVFYRQPNHFNQQHFNQSRVPAPVVPDMTRAGGFHVYPPSSSSGQNLHEAESLYPNNYSSLERERSSQFPTVTRVTGWGGYF